MIVDIVSTGGVDFSRSLFNQQERAFIFIAFIKQSWSLFRRQGIN